MLQPEHESQSESTGVRNFVSNKRHDFLEMCSHILCNREDSMNEAKGEKMNEVIHFIISSATIYRSSLNINLLFLLFDHRHPIFIGGRIAWDSSVFGRIKK